MSDDDTRMIKDDDAMMKTLVKPAKGADDAKEMAVTALQDVAPILEHARNFEVVDDGTYDVAMEGVVRCSSARNRVETIFGEARDLANKAHKAITGAIKSLTDPLKQAEKLYGGKAYAWQKQEEDRLAAEERVRQETEKKKEEDKKVVVAEFLDMGGAHEDADRVLEEPVLVKPREVVGPAKPAGTSTRENMQWECTDLKKLVDAVHAGDAPLTALTTDDKVVTKLVKALKFETRLPGIRVWDAGTVAVRK